VLQKHVTVPAAGVYNLPLWVQGLAAAGKMVLKVQRNGGTYRMTAYVVFVPDASGGYVSLDFTTDTTSTNDLYIGIGLDQSSALASGQVPADLTGGDILISQAQITAGSGRKTYVSG
jgi:hypothetical protein